jgi:MFS family permease
LTSGIIWGFAAFKPILIAQGVYGDSCTIQSILHTENGLILPCKAQDLRLNLFFVSPSTLANISTLFAGATLDRVGRRACYLISAFLLASGCLMMGSSFVIPSFDGYLAANLLLGVGGTFIFVPSFQLANAFPKHSGIVVALITGALDSSAAVFLFYRMAYDASGGSFVPAYFLFGYVTVPLLILVAELTLMPSHAYHTTPELDDKIKYAMDGSRDIHDFDDEISNDQVLRRVRGVRAELPQAKLDQIEDVMGDFGERQERIKIEDEREAVSGVWGALHGLPTHKQMATPWCILMLLLTIIQMLRMNYFIATIRSQYQIMLGSEEAAKAINYFFDASLPIAGVISTPFIGLILNKLSDLSLLLILTVFIAAIGTLNCLPFITAGYATVIAFVIFRPLYCSIMS